MAEREKDWFNDKTWEYTSRHGTNFIATRCDFRGGIDVVVPAGATDLHLVSDTAEMVAYHAIHIFKSLNGFAGYDTVDYRIRRA